MSDPNTPDTTQDVNTLDDATFNAEITRIIDNAEQKRLKKMQQHRDRMFMNTTLTLLIICVGSGLFGWFFLVSGDLGLALLSLIVTVIPPIFLNSWVQGPIRQYREEYKSEFMPALAKALGGLKFYPKRGISRKVLSRTGIVPAHQDYNAEDFFIGRYNGMKMMMSEARLTHPKKRGEKVFDGIFVLIETPSPIFQGHTILTADKLLASRLSKKLQPLPIPPHEYSGLFSALSSKPEAAGSIVKNEIIKEFGEMHDLFARSPLSAAFFQGKYVFVMIPYDEDMFEASNIFVPVTTNDAAMRCKREIEQITSIIDILNHLGQAPEEEPIIEEFVPTDDDGPNTEAETESAAVSEGETTKTPE